MVNKDYQNSGGIGVGRSSQRKTCNISETGQKRTKGYYWWPTGSHIRFQLVPKLSTLDDLEGPLCTLLQDMCVYQSSPVKIWMKIDPCYQWGRCSSTLVSGSVRFMQIFAGFPGEGMSNDSGVVENNFSVISLAIPSVTSII